MTRGNKLQGVIGAFRIKSTLNEPFLLDPCVKHETVPNARTQKRHFCYWLSGMNTKLRRTHARKSSFLRVSPTKREKGDSSTEGASGEKFRFLSKFWSKEVQKIATVYIKFQQRRCSPDINLGGAAPETPLVPSRGKGGAI